jgi:ATP-dependent exoDNAse (exonuclease V) beta subunit
MSRLPRDQAIRDRALDPQESFHLEAPAGSGKTTVLLDRFLALLSRVEAPEELLALTFTRKAAGELRTRVADLFRAREELGAAAPEPERRRRDLVQQAFRRHVDRTGYVGLLERLQIMTFHSFCARLLRLAPQEAGVPLEFRLLEDHEEQWLKQEALEELQHRLADQPASHPVRLALVRRLVRLNNNWPRLAQELRELLGRRDGLGEFLQLARASRQEKAYRELLDERLRILVSRDLEELQAAFAGTDLGAAWPEFWQALARQGAPLAGKLPPRLPGAAPADLPAWQTLAEVLLTQKGEPRKVLSPRAGFPAGLSPRWPALVQDLPPEVARQLHQLREFHLLAVSPGEVEAVQDLVILLGEALSLYQELLGRHQALDFIALEEAALRLLDTGAPRDLLLSLDCRLRHLLVDEFQDTSQNQMTLLCRLLAGWEDGAGRTLTVVGDPKQSIYGWRQAKLRLFLAARRGLPCEAGAFPLEPLFLATNFRATRTLIDWVNQVFDTVMTGTLAEVEFHPAVPKPGAVEGPSPGLALFTGTEDLDPRQAEARWLAARVAQAATQCRPGEKIGVLLFARTHLTVYLEAFQNAGLAVRVREGLKLLDSRVVQYLHNLTRALTRPQDGVAWAALLRGPWGRHPLTFLARAAATPADLWPEKLGFLAEDPEAPPELRRRLAALRAARQRVGREPLAALAARWLTEVEAWEGLAAWEGPAGVANARTYLDLLAEAEAHLPEATLARTELILPEVFQPPDPRAQDSPVEVLTVHRAKGLEFDTVFVPHLDWQPLQVDLRNPPPFLLEEVPGTSLYGLALARPYAQASHSPLYRALRHLKNRRVLAEARRVFYVAVTRARHRLRLSAVLKPNRQGHLKPPVDSPLGWLWHHYRGHAATGVLPTLSATWPQPDLEVELFQEVPALPAPVPGALDLPPPLEFAPEPAPYRLEFPSGLTLTGEEAASAPLAPDSLAARLRGEVVHRLLESLSRGAGLPGPTGVAAALRQGGLALETAGPLAADILAEVEACRQEPFLARLLAPGLPEAVSEGHLEARPAPDLVRRGRFDLLAHDGRHWWLLDYKTSRPAPGEDWEEFMARETEKYRPQLLAYRDMAARARGLPPESIRLALYFTALPGAVELED